MSRFYFAEKLKYMVLLFPHTAEDVIDILGGEKPKRSSQRRLIATAEDLIEENRHIVCDEYKTNQKLRKLFRTPYIR